MSIRDPLMYININCELFAYPNTDSDPMECQNRLGISVVYQ